MLSSLGRFHTIRKRSDFLAARNAPSAGSRSFLLIGRKRGDDAPARFGFTVTKKLGGAVTRNRIRRRLREAVRHCHSADLADRAPIEKGTDYILIARKGSLTREFGDLLDDLQRALLRLSQHPK